MENYPYDTRKAENELNRCDEQKSFIKASTFISFFILSEGASRLDRAHFRLKAVIISALILVLIFTAACQPTPEEKVVVGRQNDIMETITPVSSEDFRKIEVPKYVSKSYNDFAILSLTFDAEVVVPETTSYPVTEVSKAPFSDAKILSLIEQLAGTNDKLYSEWSLTKSEWLEKLTAAKQYVSSGIVTTDYIDYLQKSYDMAEEEVENPLVQFYELSNDRYSTLYVEAENDNVAMFYFQKNGNQFSYFRDKFLEIAPASLYEDNDFDENFDILEHFKWLQPDNPEIVQEDAYEQALEYINELGIDLVLYYAEPCTVLVDAVDKSVGWRFIFTRKISNMQVPYRDDIICIEPDALPSYGAPWAPEMCEIVIDENGLCKLWWQGASDISNVAFNSVELEQFDTIEDRIANQLNYIYGTSTRDNEIGLEIKITKIALETSLISAQDETDIGIYIPTWYVDYYIKWSDADDSEKNWELNTIIFNAIDGSYIEPRVTNKKIMSISSS